MDLLVTAILEHHSGTQAQGGFTAQRFQFGDFTLDTTRYRLERGGRPIRLEKIPMELLLFLMHRQGELVSREEISEQLWGKDVFLDFEHSINTAVRKVRAALRDDPDKPRYVETVVGKGYRFAAAVICSDGATHQEPAPQDAAQAEPFAAAQPRPQPDRAVPATRSIASGRMLLLAVAVLLLVIAAIALLRRSSTVTVAGIKSLAVLPLKNLSGDASQEYLADGMTEAIIGRLSGLHGLRVISRTSSMRFKDSRLSVPGIAKSLGADALVEGSVIREGNRIRVTAQLIRGATDEHFWSETYDRELPDVLALQSDVAQAIARKVDITVSGREHEALVAGHRVSTDAYESYLKGEFAFHNAESKAALEESIRYYEDAIKKDPAFAPAYVGFAAVHANLGTVIVGGRPDLERPQAIAAARKALELDPNLSDAHVLLADTEQKQWQWAEAEAEYRRALELNPNLAGGYGGLAQWLLCQGRVAEAITLAERARELDLRGEASTGLAWILLQARQYDDAIREYRAILSVRPNDVTALWQLGFALSLQGKANEAIPLIEKAVAVSDRSSGTLDWLSLAYARAGRRADAVRILHELNQRQQRSYVPAAALVIIYVGLGDREQAFAWLEEAYKERSNILQFVKVHPVFDPLRGDPRFADLVRRVGLGS